MANPYPPPRFTLDIPTASLRRPFVAARKISPRSPAALRAMALRLAGRRQNYEVPQPRQLGLNGNFAVFERSRLMSLALKTFFSLTKTNRS